MLNMSKSGVKVYTQDGATQDEKVEVTPPLKPMRSTLIDLLLLTLLIFFVLYIVNAIG
jgi:hypothetical protein